MSPWGVDRFKGVEERQVDESHVINLSQSSHWQVVRFCFLVTHPPLPSVLSSVAPLSILHSLLNTLFCMITALHAT